MSKQNSEDQIVLHLAAPGQRILARFIDTATFLFIAVVLQIGFGLAFGRNLGFFGFNPMFDGFASRSFYDYLAIMGILAIVTTLIYIFFFVVVPGYIFKGQTFGKKALKIKLLQVDGEEVEIIDVLKREGVRSLLMFVLCIPILSILSILAIFIFTVVNLALLFNDNMGKTLYDMMAKTIVVEA